MREKGSFLRLKWAIFCHVIDNWGDLGVCWRLACNLAERGQQVRLFVDNPEILQWMAPGGADGVEQLTWTTNQVPEAAIARKEQMDDVLIEAFGCKVPPDYLEEFARRTRRLGRSGKIGRAHV